MKSARAMLSSGAATLRRCRVARVHITTTARMSTAVVQLSDEDVEHVARLSLLSIGRSSPDFSGIKKDLESVLTLLRHVREQADDGDTPPSVVLLDDADARLAQLRPDIVATTPADAVLRHAPSAHREGSFFKVSEDT